jgi:mannosyltransferase OCH1-like enzyme
MKIPKIAHLVWNHRGVLESDHPLMQNGLHSLIRLNPDWKVTVYTPTEVDADLRSLLSAEDYKTVSKRNFVSRIDLWRLFKMFNEGGLYLDIDKMVNVLLSEVIGEGISWVLPTTREYDFSCDLLLSAPGNPAYKTAYEMYLARMNSGWDHQYFLGPQTYMHAVSYTLLGEIVNTDPGEEKFAQLRAKIAEIPFISTYREVPFNDMLLYRGDKGDELEAIKRDFYAKEGVNHWTGDW